MGMLQQIDHIGIAVKDLDETVAFYRHVMGLEVSATEVFNGMKIAFLRIGDSELELQDMRAKGIALIDERPRLGARHARVAFLHPKSTKGVLIEFVEPQSAPQP